MNEYLRQLTGREGKGRDGRRSVPKTEVTKINPYKERNYGYWKSVTSLVCSSSAVPLLCNRDAEIESWNHSSPHTVSRDHH